jgi:hypothetical protein
LYTSWIIPAACTGTRIILYGFLELFLFLLATSFCEFWRVSAVSGSVLLLLARRGSDSAHVNMIVSGKGIKFQKTYGVLYEFLEFFAQY